MKKLISLTIATLMLYLPMANASVYYYRCKEDDHVQNIFRAYYTNTFSGMEIAELQLDINKFAAALFEVNPQVKDWQHLKKDTIIIVPAFNYKKPKLSLGVFYTASQGDFTEKLKGDPTNVDSTQVSPYTLGFMSQYQIGGSNYSLANSIYFSKLNASTVTKTLETNSPKLTIPLEIGGNAYAQYSLKTMPITPYFGLDFERMTTFNVAELQTGAELATRQNTFVFATGGLSYNFNFIGIRFHVKGSISKTMASTTSSTNSADKFTGTRRMIYLNAKLEGPWVIHMFHKHHDLDGPTQLTINRIGIGFGYFFY